MRKINNYSGLKQRFEDACIDYVERFINKQKYFIDWKWQIPSKTVLIKVKEKEYPHTVNFDDIRFDIDRNILPGNFTKFLKEENCLTSYEIFLKNKMLL